MLTIISPGRWHFIWDFRPGIFKQDPSHAVGIGEHLQMVDDSQVVEWGLVCE